MHLSSSTSVQAATPAFRGSKMKAAERLSSVRVPRVVGQSRVPPYSCGRHVTRFHEDICRVAPALKQGVKHFMATQPLLTQGTGREIDTIAFPHPPGVGHLAV